MAKATTTPESKIVIGVDSTPSRYSAPVAQPAATTVGSTASKTCVGRRNAGKQDPIAGAVDQPQPEPRAGRYA